MKINPISNQSISIFKGNKKEQEKQNIPLFEHIQNTNIPDYADEFIPTVYDSQKVFLENLFKSIQKSI